jgi:DNA-binding NarL/FixJ family response regulator
MTDAPAKVISFTDERPVRIVVVDDHPFMRDLISTMLRRQCDRYQVIAQTGDAGAAIKACEAHLPDLLILDINLPDISGIEAVPRIKNASPRTRILLCTAFVTEDRIIDALRSGAHGFVEKTNTWDDFADAVARVSRGEQYFCCQSSPGLSELTTPKQHEREMKRAVPLSPREREVVTLIAHGRTNKEIATALGLSVGTIDTHRANLMRKLKIRNIAGLVVYAFRTGLIKLPREARTTATDAASAD